MMSPADSAQQHRNYITIKDPNPDVMLSLNDVFKESMKRAQKGWEKMDMVVRCESLPSMKGNRAAIETLFTTLIKMIIENQVVGPRRFLYIDCEEQHKLSSDGQKEFLIKFYTNTSTNEEWKELNAQTIRQCQDILSAHHGRLTVNNVTKTGCLFSIALPGKFE